MFLEQHVESTSGGASDQPSEVDPAGVILSNKEQFQCERALENPGASSPATHALCRDGWRGLLPCAEQAHTCPHTEHAPCGLGAHTGTHITHLHTYTQSCSHGLGRNTPLALTRGVVSGLRKPGSPEEHCQI